MKPDALSKLSPTFPHQQQQQQQQQHHPLSLSPEQQLLEHQHQQQQQQQQQHHHNQPYRPSHHPGLLPPLDGVAGEGSDVVSTTSILKKSEADMRGSGAGSASPEGRADLDSVARTKEEKDALALARSVSSEEGGMGSPSEDDHRMDTGHDALHSDGREEEDMNEEDLEGGMGGVGPYGARRYNGLGRFPGADGMDRGVFGVRGRSRSLETCEEAREFVKERTLSAGAALLGGARREEELDMDGDQGPDNFLGGYSSIGLAGNSGNNGNNDHSSSNSSSLLGEKEREEGSMNNNSNNNGGSGGSNTNNNSSSGGGGVGGIGGVGGGMSGPSNSGSSSSSSSNVGPVGGDSDLRPPRRQIERQNLNTRMIPSSSSRKQRHPMRRFSSAGSEQESSPQCTSSSLPVSSTTAEAVERGDLDDSDLVTFLLRQGRVHKCVHCHVIFEDASLFLLHNGFHSHEEPFRCVVCHKPCKDRIEFNCHLTGHIK